MGATHVSQMTELERLGSGGLSTPVDPAPLHIIVVLCITEAAVEQHIQTIHFLLNVLACHITR